MRELFAKPAVGAIIEKCKEDGVCILIQERYKEHEHVEKGLLEIPAGKIREYENIYQALRREVKEETGLDITEIAGEEKKRTVEVNGYKVMSYEPFDCSQNFCGGYSIILQTFLCRATGKLVKQTNETRNIHWVLKDKLKEMLEENVEMFYPMHVNTLKKYLSI